MNWLLQDAGLNNGMVSFGLALVTILSYWIGYKDKKLAGPKLCGDGK